MRRRVSLCLALAQFFLAVCSHSEDAPAPPTDSPVAGMGYSTRYPWAEKLVNWSSVFNVQDYKNDFDAAQKAALAKGGGVVYFPAGTYEFKENLNLESGIVIRGEPTYDKAKEGKEPGRLAPKTVFKCPDRQHVGILNYDSNASNLGVVNIDSDGCAIMLWPGLAPGPWSQKAYWWFATDVKGMGRNKIVLGNRIRNVNLGDPSSPHHADQHEDIDPDRRYRLPYSPRVIFGEDLTEEEVRARLDGSRTFDHDAKLGKGDISHTADTSWPWRFSTALAVYSDENALVANNLVAKATSSAKVSVAGYNNVPYPYDNRYGIDVNRQLVGAVYGRKVSSNPGLCAGTEKNFPWSFRPGLVIRDNYVFQNGRIGICFSGAGDGKTVGSGTEVTNNHVEVASGTTLYSVDGVKKAGNSATNENRGYDQVGWENNVTVNSGHINRQKIVDSNYMSVDGEGLLVQCEGGNNQFRNFWKGNDLSGGGSGYVGYYKNQQVEDNTIEDNKVNSDQMIGFVTNQGDVLKNNKCQGNEPKCSCHGPGC